MIRVVPLFWVLFKGAPGFLGIFLAYSRISGYYFFVKFDLFELIQIFGY